MGRTATKLTILASPLLVLAGCKGGGGSGDAAGDDVLEDIHEEAPEDAAEDGEADAAEEPVIGPLTVIVVEAENNFIDMIVNSTVPIEGATVALDAPDGTRSEQTTGTDGRVTFEDLDWSLGTAAVTVHGEGMALRSAVGLDGSVDEITIGMFPANLTHDAITLSGTATSMSDTSHMLGVYASSSFIHSVAAGPDWSMLASAGVAFTLVGLEWIDLADPPSGYAQQMVAWTRVEHASVTSDTTVGVDFSSPLTPVNVSDSITLPTYTPASPFFGGTRATGWIETDGCPHGFIELTEPGSDGASHDIDWEYVVGTDSTTTRTHYQLQTMNPYMQGVSEAIVPGPPAAGAHDLDFLDIPVISQSSTSTYPLHDTTITWALAETGVHVVLPIWKDRAELTVGDPVWWIDAPIDSTSLDVPEPPSTVDPDTFLGTEPLAARLRIISPPGTDGILRFADGKFLKLQP